VLFELAKAINRGRDAGASADALAEAAHGLSMLGGVLGLRLDRAVQPGADSPRGEAGEAETAGLVDLLLELRGSARAAGQWAMADRIRDGMAELGFELIDGPDGTLSRRRGT
jgi:cysteinyl-tRNA synthetase